MATSIRTDIHPATVLAIMFGFLFIVFALMFITDHYFPYTPPVTSSHTVTDTTPRTAPVTGIMGSRSVVAP